MDQESDLEPCDHPNQDKNQASSLVTNQAPVQASEQAAEVKIEIDQVAPSQRPEAEVPPTVIKIEPTAEPPSATVSSDPRLKRGASYGSIPFTKMRRAQ